MNKIFIIEVDKNTGNTIRSGSIHMGTNNGCGEWGTGIVEHPGGGYVICGSSAMEDLTNHGYDLYMAHIDNAFNIIWEKYFGAHTLDPLLGYPDAAFDEAFDVQLVFDPLTQVHIGFVLAGLIHDKRVNTGCRNQPCGTCPGENQGQTNAYIVRTDLYGNLLWQYIADNPPAIHMGYSNCTPATFTSIDEATEIRQTSDGNFVVGMVMNKFTMAAACTLSVNQLAEYKDADIVLLKVDDDPFGTGTPSVIWQQHIAHFSGADFALDFEETPDDGFLVLGTTGDNGIKSVPEEEFLLVKTDDQANVQWIKPYHSIGSEACGFALDLTADGGAIVVGNNADRSDDYVVLKLHPCPPMSPYYNYSNTIDITQNTTWTSDTREENLYIIKNNASLTITNARIQFSTQSGIVVEPGGNLFVDNSTLTGLDYCETMWPGIVLKHGLEPPQPPVPYVAPLVSNAEITNNSLVEHAHIAVQNVKTTTPPFGMMNVGGTLVAENSTFKNNRTGFKFGSNSGRNCSVSSCNFICDGPLRDLVLYTGSGTKTFIEMDRTHGILFTGNSFENTGSFDPDDLGTGILSYNSSYTVTDCPNPTYQGACPYPPGPSPNVFTNLYQGIDAYSYGGIFNNIRVYNNHFDGAYKGITTNGSAYDEFRGNTFDIPLSAISNTYGAYLYNSTGYLVTENTFNGMILPGTLQPAFGLIVRNTGGSGTGVVQRFTKTISMTFIPPLPRPNKITPVFK